MFASTVWSSGRESLIAESAAWAAGALVWLNPIKAQNGKAWNRVRTNQRKIWKWRRLHMTIGKVHVVCQNKRTRTYEYLEQAPPSRNCYVRV